MKKEKEFIELENENGEIQKIEIFGEVKSERDNKVYVLFTTDEELKDEVNMTVGYIYEENDRMNLEIVENDEELNYVFDLINKALEEA